MSQIPNISFNNRIGPSLLEVGLRQRESKDKVFENLGNKLFAGISQGFNTYNENERFDREAELRKQLAADELSQRMAQMKSTENIAAGQLGLGRDQLTQQGRQFDRTEGRQFNKDLMDQLNSTEGFRLQNRGLDIQEKDIQARLAQQTFGNNLQLQENTRQDTLLPYQIANLSATAGAKKDADEERNSSVYGTAATSDVRLDPITIPERDRATVIQANAARADSKVRNALAGALQSKDRATIFDLEGLIKTDPYILDDASEQVKQVIEELKRGSVYTNQGLMSNNSFQIPQPLQNVPNLNIPKGPQNMTPSTFQSLPLFLQLLKDRLNGPTGNSLKGINFSGIR